MIKGLILTPNKNGGPIVLTQREGNIYEYKLVFECMCLESTTDASLKLSP